VVHRYATGSAVHGMTAVGSSLWVATQNSSGAGHRGGTLVVAEVGVPGDLGDYLDPPLSYITNEVAALRPVYDTLVAYRTTGGFSGLTLVPDLADSIPSPENGGRSYTFFLRPNLRYSTGATVLASDFRRGIARELIAGDGYGNPGLYFGILGARHCHDVPTQCDLRAGVDVDNQARRITFHLERPDEAFLYKLAILLAVQHRKIYR
jgi:peptide/nickel transport system substrate-binding protein